MKLFFVDCETTGVDPTKNGVVQVAGCAVLGEGREEPFNFLMRPFASDVIDDAALRVNGRTREEIAAFPETLQTQREMTRLFDRCVDRYNRSDKMWFVAYNAMFDYQFLRQFWQKSGDQFFGSYFWHPPLCLMTLAGFALRQQRGSLPNFKLATVCDCFGIEGAGKLHDAVEDIRLARELYHRLERVMKGEDIAAQIGF